MTYIQDTLEAMKDLDRVSSRFVIQAGIIGQIRRAPLGVVLCMGPFNYPLNETFTTLIPALIMGNTVVFKPPRFGVLLFRAILKAFKEAFPPGVVNTVYGDGSVIIGPLMTSGKVDALAFIGTSRVADVIQQQHPKPHRLRTVLGLDAKNPAIVLADADLDLAVRECVTRQPVLQRAALHGLENPVRAPQHLRDFPGADLGGHRPVEIRDAVGAGGEPDAVAGTEETGIPARIDRGCAGARGEGGQPERRRRQRRLSSIRQCCIPVNAHMRVYTEEQFGPVIPVLPFDDIEEPMQLHRRIELRAAGKLVWKRSRSSLARLIDPLVNQVCRVNLNSQCQRGPDTFPYTGRKDSAEGTLSVSDALRVFSIRTLVAAKADPLNKEIITDITRNNKSNFLTTNFIL